MNCPDCGSSNTQKSSALYEQGVRTTQGRSAGIFLTSRGTIGVGKSRHQSRSSTLAADINAPHHGLPVRSMIAFAVGFLAAFVSQAAGGGFFLFVGLILGGFFTGIYLSAPNNAELAEKGRYESQWYCRKCGSIFHNFSPCGTVTPEQPNQNDFVSPVVRLATRRTRQSYIDRVRSPVQRASIATPRDLAGLKAIRESSSSDGTFDPEVMNCDLGIISRLSSLKYVTYNEGSERFIVAGNGSVEQPHVGWWQRTFG